MDSSGTIQIDGYKLKYRIEGNGPDTLVVGSSIYYPRSFSQELRNSLRMIFVDWRGFAEPPTSTPKVPTFDTLMDDIDQVRQALGIEKCIIIGHSAHGLLAFEYAKKYPRHISHVVMIGISPNLGPEHAAMAQRNWDESVWPERKAALDERIRQFPDTELAGLPPAERFVKWNVRRSPQSWFDYNFNSASLWHGISPNMALLDFFYGVALRDLDIKEGLEALRDLDIKEGLEALNIPVFLALGRFDYIIAPASSWDPIRPQFKDLTVKIFERSGHSPQYEEPALFNAELLNWLNQDKNKG